MQDFIDQAKKNNVTLLDKGNCQFCGAEFQKGIFECMNNYNNGLALIDFNNSENNIYRFLSVDAHALQHPEIHGRWSNHFHLTRLNLILEKRIIWDYKTSPLLSNYLNEYKINRQNEFLKPPYFSERGTITTKDFITITSTEECVELIHRWAEEVYIAWKENHLVASQIAEGFLNNKFFEYTHRRKTTPR
jgi:hypothetical protein